MKNSIKKFISIVMCAIMLFAVSAVYSAAASYADPVFSVTVLSETNSEVTVSLNLVSGTFNCADFTFTADDGYTCTVIDMGDSLKSFNAEGGGGMGQSNNSNGAVSIACMNLYSKTGSFYVATFSKANAESFKTGDVKVVFSNCSILEDGETIVLGTSVKYPVELSISDSSIEMNYKDSANLTYSTNAPAGCAVTWSTSDSGVATVDEDGDIYAAGKGDATITCTVTDASGAVLASESCDVTVNYSFGQWLIIIFLFGFIWYI